MSTELLPENGRLVTEKGEYFSASAIAALNIKGMPKSRAGVYKKAEKEGWPVIFQKGRGAKDGVKYFLLPDNVQSAVAAKPYSTEPIKPLVSGGGDHIGLKANDHPRGGMDDFVLVPRYDVQVSAGYGAAIHSEQIVDYLAFRSEWVKNALGVSQKDLALISVKGDSMEPTLSNGDLILIDIRNGRIEDNAIYVLQYNGDLLVKRIQRKLDGTVIVKSDNSAMYEPDILDSTQARDLRVLGRVVWSGRRM